MQKNYVVKHKLYQYYQFNQPSSFTIFITTFLSEDGYEFPSAGAAAVDGNVQQVTCWTETGAALAGSLPRQEH